MISKNVMKMNEFNESIYYRVACDCGSNEDDVTIEFEFEKDCPDIIFLNFHKNILWSYNWGNLNWLQRLWRRITCSLTMLFKGRIELEESFILRGESNIDGFIEALIEGKSLIKKKMEIPNAN